MFYVLLVGLFITSVVWYIRHYLQNRRLYRLASKYDGPRPLPVIGNILSILIPLKDITEKHIQASLHYTSPSRLWIGSHLSIVIWDPENTKIVLNSPHALDKQPHIYNLIEQVTGSGLVTLPVKKWKHHRKLLSPMFNRKILNSFFDVFTKHSKHLIEDVSHWAGAGVFDGHDDFVKYGLNNIMDAILDLTENEDCGFDSHQFGKYIQGITEGIITKLTNVWYYSDFIFKRSVAGKKMQECRNQLLQVLTAVIQKWENESNKIKTQQRAHDNEKHSYKPMKLIDHLLSINDGSGKFTSEDLNGEVMTILTAGIETTSSIMGYALILLGMYPEVQEKVYQEIIQVLGKKSHLDCNDLKELVYLKQVIKETVRLFPAITLLGRFNNQEIQLTNHIIPANSSIIIGTMALHRNPNIWPNPTKFDPDRFLPNEEDKRHPYCWIGFSAGLRNCIGKEFAYMSLKIVLSTFLLRYKVATDYKSVEDIHLTMTTIFKPTKGYRLSISLRK